MPGNNDSEILLNLTEMLTFEITQQVFKTEIKDFWYFFKQTANLNDQNIPKC